ncbi:MAG: tetratricopeptide repeat protein [Acidobacteriota bacterium]|nr:tetratricopeptide repeat protein [Acidobacteriota bacterium]
MMLLSAASGAWAQGGEPVEGLDIMALSPEIERLVEQRVHRNLPQSAVVRELMDLLFGRDGLDIAYGNSETKTAVETFESRSGNCLSFTVLFVAMARHVGVEAHFQEVMEILSWDRRGDVAVNNRHMFAEIETPSGVLQVDFLPGVEKRYRFVRRISEERVLAHYYNNLGAEALAREEFEPALEMLSKSLEADGRFAPAWVNRGVAHKSKGNYEEAERCYLEALRIDSNEMSAAANLANLYQSQGSEGKARPYMKMARRHQRRNPFYHFRLSLESAAKGSTKETILHLQRAIARLPEDAFFRLELAQAFVRVGRPKKANRQINKAIELALPGEESENVTRLAEKIRAGIAGVD